MTHTIATEWAKFFLEVARQHGQDPDAWLTSRGYAADVLAAGRAPFELEEHIFADMAERVPDFGLAAARSLVIGAFPRIDYALMASANLGEALVRISEFSRYLNSGYRFVSRRTTGGVELAVVRIAPGDRILPARAVFTIAALTQLGRNLAADGPTIDPVGVSFRHREPADLDALRVACGPHLRFSQPRDSVMFRQQDLERPNPAAEPSLAKILGDAARDEVSVVVPERFVERARAEISIELAFGVPAAPDIAARLGLSLRTLHRQLASHGTSFGDLLQEIRFERAQAWLEEGVSATAVASLVFYSEVAAFFRAYRRHFGHNPSEAGRSR
ncbi:MAG: AraC family transcriptional regulator ligand-binding domain-containing protein [Kofleriaceae bacterium]